MAFPPQTSQLLWNCGWPAAILGQSWKSDSPPHWETDTPVQWLTWWCHGEVIRDISAWAWRRHNCGCLSVRDTLQVHCGKCRRQCFWSLTLKSLSSDWTTLICLCCNCKPAEEVWLCSRLNKQSEIPSFFRTVRLQNKQHNNNNNNNTFRYRGS